MTPQKATEDRALKGSFQHGHIQMILDASVDGLRSTTQGEPTSEPSVEVIEQEHDTSRREAVGPGPYTRTPGDIEARNQD
jgi:hypothetical protein